MSDTLPGTSVRRRRGPSRVQLDVTLTAWKAAGILAGPEHAAHRSALRDAAEAVDAARDAVRAARERGDNAGALTLSTASERLFGMLAAVVPLERGEDTDGLAAFLAGLGTAEVRH